MRRGVREIKETDLTGSLNGEVRYSHHDYIQNSLRVVFLSSNKQNDFPSAFQRVRVETVLAIAVRLKVVGSKLESPP
jgi:hypothetical protein